MRWDARGKAWRLKDQPIELNLLTSLCSGSRSAAAPRSPLVARLATHDIPNSEPALTTQYS